MFIKTDDGIMVSKTFLDAVQANISKLKVQCDHPSWMESRDYIHNNSMSIVFGCPQCGLIFKHNFLAEHLKN